MTRDEQDKLEQALKLLRESLSDWDAIVVNLSITDDCASIEKWYWGGKKNATVSTSEYVEYEGKWEENK